MPEIPEMPEIPIGIEGTDVRINAEKGVILSTELGGVPLDVTIGRDGVDVKPAERSRQERQ